MQSGGIYHTKPKTRRFFEHAICADGFCMGFRTVDEKTSSISETPTLARPCFSRCSSRLGQGSAPRDSRSAKNSGKCRRSAAISHTKTQKSIMLFPCNCSIVSIIRDLRTWGEGEVDGDGEQDCVCRANRPPHTREHPNHSGIIQSNLDLI